MEGRSLVAAAWGAFVARHRWLFVAAWLIAALAMAGFAAATPRLLSPSGFEADTDASRATDLLRQHFPQRQVPVVFVVLQSDQVPVADPRYQAQLAAWKADLQRRARGTGATVQGPVPGRDGRTAAVLVESAGNPADFVDLGRHAQAITHPGPAHSYVGGFGTVYNDFITDSEADLQSAERISFPIALVLLLLVFGGVVAASLPLVTGLATVTVAVALLGFVARVHTVSVFSLNATSIIGIGLGIDYSLLVVNRFREEMRAGSTVEDAVAATVGTAGVATVISGGTVAIGFGALMLSRLNVLWSMGVGGAIVVVISVLSSLTLIPALLAIFGQHVDRFALPFTHDRDSGPFWHWLANRVMARPVVFIGVALVAVAILLWPARGLLLGVEGTESLPPGDPARTAELLAERQLGFASQPPTLVVAHGVHDLAQAAALEAKLRPAAEGRPVQGPTDVPPAELPLYLRDGYAVFELQQPASDNDRRTRDWLGRLQRIDWPPGVSVMVGGEAAAYRDYLDVLIGDFPLVVGTVVACTLVLLGIAFRSVVLPVKAVLMNLLSVGAAMGVLTWGFQEGHFSGVLDFQAVGFVDATIPAIIFAALFGLSMDYEVFLLSRIREQWARGADNASAVALGMERTGQIITSAALILVAVSSTMAFSHLAINKGLGVSFAIAILLDATLIRLLLVPAMMRVLSDLNWWPSRRRF